MKRLASIIILTFFLNLVWEKLQMYFYSDTVRFSEHWERCLVASLGDVFLVGVIFFLQAIIFQDGHWFISGNITKWITLVALSIIVAIIVETWGLHTGRWAYHSRMPIVPLLEVGILPILQMVVLVPIIVFFTQRQTRI